MFHSTKKKVCGQSGVGDGCPAEWGLFMVPIGSVTLPLILALPSSDGGQNEKNSGRQRRGEDRKPTGFADVRLDVQAQAECARCWAVDARGAETLRDVAGDVGADEVQGDALGAGAAWASPASPAWSASSCAMMAGSLLALESGKRKTMRAKFTAQMPAAPRHATS